MRGNGYVQSPEHIAKRIASRGQIARPIVCVLEYVKCRTCAAMHSGRTPSNMPTPFCSRECREIGAKTEHRTRRFSGVYTCTHCQRQHHPRQARYNKFCSRECSYAAAGGRALVRAAIKEAERHRPCDICDAKFRVRGRARVCSVACRLEVKRRDMRQRDRAAYVRPQPTACLHCAQLFTSTYGDKRKSFCSVVCRRGVRAKHHKRAEAYGAKTIERFARHDIFVRDNWTCWLCNTPIKREKRFPHPLSPTLDHVIPLSRGGDHSKQNSRCAHLLCNLKKGARLVAA